VVRIIYAQSILCYTTHRTWLLTTVAVVSMDSLEETVRWWSTTARVWTAAGMASVGPVRPPSPVSVIQATVEGSVREEWAPLAHLELLQVICTSWCKVNVVCVNELIGLLANFLSTSCSPSSSGINWPQHYWYCSRCCGRCICGCTSVSPTCNSRDGLHHYEAPKETTRR